MSTGEHDLEAAVIPAMLVFLTHWFSSRERGRADTFLILGNPVTLLWMSALSGYLISATSYRWMFVIEGLPAIAWAFVFLGACLLAAGLLILLIERPRATAPEAPEHREPRRLFHRPHLAE